jgi:ABC-type polysaccharide/polyol phosphate transport system ATPase subunit
VAVRVDRVTKRFRLYHNPVTGPLLERMLFWRDASRFHRELEAVQDVSLQVRRGEVVGIIGSNGAGKTTLLKMIAGLLPIDAGSITVSGKVTALLAQGVGVHPEFTGRENIYYGGLLLGMSREEVQAKTPSIIEFSELGDFIERPFRTYSAGMRARLLFSISMSIDPDILIIDEALATGDSYFVSKCASRIREICDSGATILFVSHNLSQVQDICERAILMGDGRVQAEGEPADVVAAYNRWIFHREDSIAARIESDLQLTDGTGRVQVERVRLLDRDGKTATAFHSGEAMAIELDYRSLTGEPQEVTCFVGVSRVNDGQWVGELTTQYHVQPRQSGVRSELLRLGDAGTIRIDCDPLLLLNNHYDLWIMIYDRHERFCEYRGVTPFFVAREAHTIDRAPIFWQPCRFQVRDSSD